MSDFTVTEGRVYHDDIYRTPETCERLLAVYERDAKAGDWWAPESARLAQELREAVRLAGLIPQHREAA